MRKMASPGVAIIRLRYASPPDLSKSSLVKPFDLKVIFALRGVACW